MNKNTSIITMRELNLSGYDYDYRFVLPDGTTLGYLKRDRFGGCEFHFGDTQSKADANSDEILYGDTPSSIKDALEYKYWKNTVKALQLYMLVL